MIKPGSKIGVMAPSSYVEKEDIEASQAYLKSQGYDVFIHPQTYARHHQSAGTSSEKLEALHSLYADETIDVIWAAGGGNRAMDLLNGLDFGLIKANPKPLAGFSDVTCLLNAIYAQTGQAGFHACNFKDLHKHGLQAPSSMSLEQAKTLQAGHAEGIAIGGCLSLFHLLVGTDKCPDLSGAILFLEDTGDQISRFDRMFLDMKHKGVFEKIGGLVLGEFHDLQDGARPFGFSLEESVQEAIGNRDIPIIMNAPFGHGGNNHPFPLGAAAVLDTSKASIDFQL